MKPTVFARQKMEIGFLCTIPVTSSMASSLIRHITGVNPFHLHLALDKLSRVGTRFCYTSAVHYLNLTFRVLLICALASSVNLRFHLILHMAILAWEISFQVVPPWCSTLSLLKLLIQCNFEPNCGPKNRYFVKWRHKKVLILEFCRIQTLGLAWMRFIMNCSISL